jgi:uncharacterized protein (TIGR03086 family)
MNADQLQQSIASTRRVLAGVSADQLDDATPCTQWKVRDLINHLVGAQSFFAAALHGQPPADGGTDFASGDYLAAYDTGSAAALAAFREDGALERMLQLPFGEMPGAAFIVLATADTFTHGWDLAKATGQSTDLAPDLAPDVLAACQQMMSPDFRSAEGAVFGLEQTAPEGATGADRVASFLGRPV